jgi:GT2 family glycosyltransferase
MSNTIAVLITCHNRREKTISCLQSLYNCKLPENHTIDIFLVDDNSSDGTSEAVKNVFSKVNIIQGDGNLFWNRGMYLAWNTADKKGIFDYYLWVNDDAVLFENAIISLFETAPDDNSIIVGTMRSKNECRITYGGWNKGKLILPNGCPQLCNEFNGNLVLIPYNVFKRIGNLDPFFHHAIGDFDYALRAKTIGIKCYIATEYSGFCEAHQSLPQWCLPQVSIITRFKVLYSPLGNSHPYYFFRFEKRHFGLIIAIKHFLSIHLRATFPKLWKY